METKPRILYLKKILEERTDEEHPLSTTQLINILNDEYGISAHRTTVTKDIAALQEFGKDKAVIRRMAAYIGVSYTALVIRLRDMGLFEYHNILEYISNELNLGGVSQ